MMSPVNLSHGNTIPGRFEGILDLISMVDTIAPVSRLRRIAEVSPLLKVLATGTVAVQISAW
jgi:hypothetical protein